MIKPKPDAIHSEGCDTELASHTLRMMGKAFVLAQPHCHGNPFLPKHDLRLFSLRIVIAIVSISLASPFTCCCAVSRPADVPLKHVTQLHLWLISQGWPLIQPNRWDPFVWGALRLQSGLAFPLLASWEISYITITGGNAHGAANCCALQKLGQNFWDNWHDIFSFLFFFSFC